MKKFISLMLSLSVVASPMTVASFNAHAATIPQDRVTTLFSDDFEGYANGFTNNIWGGAAPTVAELSGSMEFKVYSHHEISASREECYTEKSVISEVAQIATTENSGIGSGSSLMITAQSGVQEYQLVKASGITADEANKTLVFTTKFKVPNFVGYCDGVGMYLAAPADNKYVSISNTWNLNCWAETESFPGELMYLGSRPTLANSTAWWKPRYDIENRHNQLWTFGEKVADLTPGTAYTYTITMTPDGNGGYTVTTNLNGTVKELGKEAEPNRSAIPTEAEMSNFTAVQVMRISHPYYFMTEHTRSDSAEKLSTWLSEGHGSTLGITTAEGKYNNDRVVAYFDDMSLKSVAPSGVVFSDDFEGYNTGRISGYKNWWNKKATLYDNDTFKWMNGNTTDYSAQTKYSSWIKEALDTEAGTGPEANDMALIAEETGVGSGKALKITGQIGVENYSLAKKSNLDTADIAGKQLVFGADFKAPISGVMGEGFGVWVAPDDTTVDGNVENPAIEYISNDMTIGNGTSAIIKGEFMYVGSRNNVQNGKMALPGARATYLYVFGEEVIRLNPDANYDVKVILTPNGDGYTGSVAINGRNIALNGTNLPTQAEIATFKRLYANPISHIALMNDLGGEMWTEAARPSDMVNSETGYIFGRTIGILDNIYLCAQETAEVPAADVAANMVSVNKNWTSKGTSFINAYATVSGTTATVEVRSDKTTAVTPVVMAAAYDSQDKLMNVVLDDTKTVQSFGKETVTLNGLAEGYTTVKVFVWDMEDIYPYTASFTALNSALGDGL